jgi:hypothetical protein
MRRAQAFRIISGMFIQVIQGNVRNAVGLRAQWCAWEQQLEPGAEGFLGATAGITADERFIAMVRFDSAEAARRNGERAEQSAWWATTAGLLDHPRVTNSTRTDEWNKGCAPDATFVQIRQGVSTDSERLRDLYVNQQRVRMGPYRPEVLGGAFAWHGNGAYTLSAFFNSEEAARRGEQLYEFASFFEDISDVMGDVTYYDLRDPWLI